MYYGPAEQPHLMITGDTVGFGALRRDLVEIYARWMTDLRVTRTLATPCKPMTIENELAWLDGALRGNDVVFTIYELATLRPLGNTGLHDIDERLGTAEFGMFIGETDCWGRGFGTEVTRLMLAYGFDVLGLYNVQLNVYAVNQAAIRAYERAGFRRIGARRGAMRVGRERCDVIYMDAIADEFPHTFLHEIMHPPAGDS